MSERLCVTGLSKTWDPDGHFPVRAVRDVSLDVEPGETVVITGPSGSGKTTLLSLLGGLVSPDAGRVCLGPTDLGACSTAELRQLRLRRIGFVFQRGLLLENLTACQNLTVVLRAAGESKRCAKSHATALLDRLGVGARADFLPRSLSPGEAQRVALARALALRPQLVLADEPTAHLDRESGAEVARMLRAVARENAAACVVVTHDARLHEIADRVVVLEDGRLSDGAREPRVNRRRREGGEARSNAAGGRLRPARARSHSAGEHRM